MEMKQQRVLAYTLATLVSLDELDKVSGGNAQMTTRSTLKPSGNSATGPDVIADISADW